MPRDGRAASVGGGCRGRGDRASCPGLSAGRRHLCADHVAELSRPRAGRPLGALHQSGGPRRDGLIAQGGGVARAREGAVEVQLCEARVDVGADECLRTIEGLLGRQPAPAVRAEMVSAEQDPRHGEGRICRPGRVRAGGSPPGPCPCSRPPDRPGWMSPRPAASGPSRWRAGRPPRARSDEPSRPMSGRRARRPSGGGRHHRAGPLRCSPTRPPRHRAS